MRGVCQEANTKLSAVLYLPRNTYLNTVFLYTQAKVVALIDKLYFLVVFHGVIFSSTQTPAIFGDQAIPTVYSTASCRTNL